MLIKYNIQMFVYNVIVKTVEQMRQHQRNRKEKRDLFI